jgi:putative transposase
MKSRFSREQITSILEQWRAGRRVSDLASEHGVSESAIYHWRIAYTARGTERLRQLEAENLKLKILVDGLRLDREMLKAILIRHGLPTEGERLTVSGTTEPAKAHAAIASNRQ